MDFKEFLELSIKDIDSEMVRIFHLWEKDFVSLYPQLKSLLHIFMDSTEGGKKIRGALVKLGYFLTKEDISGDINIVAAAYEIIHTALLIHDDVVDKSTLRRGKPTLYQQIGNQDYGRSQAICMGDLGFFLSYDLIGHTHFSPENKITILNVFSTVMRNTVIGQMLDVKFSLKNKPIPKEEIIEMYKLKTSNYSISGPLGMGALLSGVKKEVLDTITEVGENIGIAFQLQDDILDIFGKTEVVGKQLYGDIREGKMTYLYATAYERSDTLQRKLLDQYYGKNDLNNNEVEKIKKIFIKMQVLKEAEDLISSHIKKAKDLIPQISEKKDRQELFYGFINYLNKRIY